jgi:UDP-N-acetylglucosamine--N-acetylmuramyl-(pentapeptide) pyrophosphoryl-undecaprenol N-acetylglucosamine transferase
LNDTVPQALALIPLADRPIVTHQSGAAHLDAVRSNYAAAGVQADTQAFISDMAQALAQCDVVLCRAGAIMVSELCAAGVASVLVPLVVSTTSHQQTNAQWLAAQGAALHLPQRDLNAQQLAQTLRGLDRNNLQAMATKARGLAKLGASSTIVDLTLHLVGQRNASKQQKT